MPETEVRAFRTADGGVPILEWLDALERSDPKAYAKCLERILQLAELGHEMRRPHEDALRDGIRELRVKCGTVQYRMLYFFFAKDAAALSHGLTKEGAVPAKEIDKAVSRMKCVRRDPDQYTAVFEF